MTELHRVHRSVSVSYKQGQLGIMGTNAENFKAEPGKQVRLCGQGQEMNVAHTITSGAKVTINMW